MFSFHISEIEHPFIIFIDHLHYFCKLLIRVPDFFCLFYETYVCRMRTLNLCQICFKYIFQFVSCLLLPSVVILYFNCTGTFNVMNLDFFWKVSSH